MSMVIYAIQCRENGLTYVGRSTDHRKRWHIHRRMMKSGVHSIPQMVADWRKFGEAGFAMKSWKRWLTTWSLTLPKRPN